MIEKIELKETRDTPELIFDAENNIFKIGGNCLPEDATNFFTPIFNWVEEYIKSPNEHTPIVCNLEYFNSTSAKMFYQVFIEFEKIIEEGKTVEITWHYEAGDKLIEEKGQEYQEVLEIPVKLIEY